MWCVKFGRLRPPVEGDNGHRAWRLWHAGCCSYLAVPFARAADAARAAAIVNRECPAEGLQDARVVAAELFACYGDRAALRARLMAECCAW